MLQSRRKRAADLDHAEDRGNVGLEKRKACLDPSHLLGLKRETLLSFRESRILPSVPLEWGVYKVYSVLFLPVSSF